MHTLGKRRAQRRRMQWLDQALKNACQYQKPRAYNAKCVQTQPLTLSPSPRPAAIISVARASLRTARLPCETASASHHFAACSRTMARSISWTCGTSSLASSSMPTDKSSWRSKKPNATCCHEPRCLTFIPAKNIQAREKTGICPQCQFFDLRDVQGTCASWPCVPERQGPTATGALGGPQRLEEVPRVRRHGREDHWVQPCGVTIRTPTPMG